MMTFALVAAILFVADVSLHIFAVVQHKETLRRVTKIMLMPLLALSFYLFWSSLKPQTAVPWWVVAGMLMGCAGDTCLINHHHPVGFPLGIVSFSVGHVFYLVQMLPLISIPAWWIIVLIVAVYGVGSVITFKQLSPLLPQRYWALCLFYMLLLSGFSAIAAAAMFTGFHIGAITVFAGTLSFLLSDTILSFEIFQGDTKWGNINVMTSYIAAQILLAAGFFIWLS